jgi:hypothetical protein
MAIPFNKIFRKIIGRLRHNSGGFGCRLYEQQIHLPASSPERANDGDSVESYPDEVCLYTLRGGFVKVAAL